MRKICSGLLLLFCAYAVTACDKPAWDDAIFRCKINGQEFKASNKMANATLISSDNRLFVSGSWVGNFINKDRPDGEMKLNFYFDPQSLGMPIPFTGSNTVFYYGNNNFEKIFRDHHQDTEGFVRLDALDLDAQKVSGAFELNARSDDGTLLEIREGFFNVPFKN